MDFFLRSKKNKKPPILDLLLSGGFLKKSQIKEIEWLMDNTELEVEDILFRFISRDKILLVKSLLYNSKYQTIDILDKIDLIDEGTVNLLTREQIFENKIICINRNEDQLVVAMVDPADRSALKFVENLTGKTVKEKYITLMDDIRQLLKELDDRKIREKIRQEKENGENGEEVYGKPPDVGVMSIEEFTLGGDELISEFVGMRPIVDAIIKQGLLRGASDIHIEPTRKEMLIRYRIDGILTTDDKIDKILEQYGKNRKLHETIVNIIKNRSGESGKTMRLDETGKAQDGRIYIPEVDLDLRVSVVPTILGESVVIRIHYREIGQFTLDRLGFEPRVLKKFQKIIKQPYGIIFIAGPTGSGKTTTIYSILQILNNPSKKTMTIEDPVEYSIPGANQAQINPAKNFGFDAALRSFLRHDPDIIMVGEIRDVTTAKMAMEAALTGHIVLSSVHANNAVSTVIRLKDLGVDTRLITATCIATLGQRLVRRVCQNCKRPFMFSTKLYSAFETYKIKYNPRKLVKGAGCKECNQTGYHGRIGVFEMLPMTYDIKELILRDSTEEELFELARKSGMQSLLEDALTKVARGITTEEEVWRVTLLEGAY